MALIARTAVAGLETSFPPGRRYRVSPVGAPVGVTSFMRITGLVLMQWQTAVLVTAGASGGGAANLDIGAKQNIAPNGRFYTAQNVAEWGAARLGYSLMNRPPAAFSLIKAGQWTGPPESPEMVIVSSDDIVFIIGVESWTAGAFELQMSWLPLAAGSSLAPISPYMTEV